MVFRRITPETQPRERRVRTAALEGAVNYFMGMVQMGGGHCAPPDANDPRAEFVDFYCILKGTQLAFTVILATKLEKGQFKFVIPRQFEQCVVIGLVPLDHGKVDVLHMPSPLIDAHKTRKGGYFEIQMRKHGARYLTKGDEWLPVKDFNHF